MKTRFILSTIFALSMLLSFSASAFPVFSGFHGQVEFSDGSVYNAHTGTPRECSNSLEAKIAEKQELGIMVVQIFPCTAQFEEFPDYWSVEKEIFGPHCLSCPFFNPDTVRFLFPNHYYPVTKLMQKYDIENFNAEYRKLELKYNLGEFMNDLNKIIHNQ